MSFWKGLRDQAALNRLREEEIYAMALREIESGTRRDGLWAKAIIEAAGNENSAKIRYMQLLVTAIRDEQYLFNRLAEERQAEADRTRVADSQRRAQEESIRRAAEEMERKCQARNSMADLRDHLWDLRANGRAKGQMKGRELRYYIKTDGLAPMTEVRCSGETEWLSPALAMPYLTD